MSMEILRYSAFSALPNGGNPAGVILEADDLDAAEMQSIAADVGYSETAFLRASDDGALSVRYFSPAAEVPFCGHATIATAVAHAERHGTGTLDLGTPAGRVPVTTRRHDDGRIAATLISVPPRVEDLEPGDLGRLLEALDWEPGDLDSALPPRIAYAGARHPIIAAGTRERLARLDYDFAALGELMRRRDWTTVDLVWRESDAVFHARNPFPPGGVVEDPATGAAAAALGGYLRHLGLVDPPAALTIHQGHDMGRPGTITVGIPAEDDSGIAVSGTAVPIPR